MLDFLSNQKKYLIIFLGGALVVTAYQNCGVPAQMGQSESMSIAAEYGGASLGGSTVASDIVDQDADAAAVVDLDDECDKIYYEEFIREQGYRQFLRNNCAGCHAGQRATQPAFAHEKATVAFSVFKQKEIESGSISARALSEHQPGITGKKNESVINEFKQGFAALEDKYNACKGIVDESVSLTSTAIQMSKVIEPLALSTADKANLRTEVGFILDSNKKLKKFNFSLNPYQKLIYKPATKTHEVAELKKYGARTFSFSLSKASWDVASNEVLPDVTVSVLIAPSVTTKAITQKIDGKDYTTGYTQVVNPYISVGSPSFKMNSKLAGMAWSLKNISFLVNDTVQDYATVYQILKVNLCSTNSISVMKNNNSQLLVFDKINASDLIKLKFKDVKKNDLANVVCTQDEGSAAVALPATVSYNDLVGAGINAVFTNNCTSCHSASSASGGLDLTNYESAKAKAATILSRMNSSTNPMPRSGLLDERSRKVVELWLNGGLK